MALLDATLNSMGDHLATLITHFSLHSADPGTTGANAVGTRVAATWSAAATGGDISDGPVAFTGLPANQTVTHIGYWSAATAGTFRGSRALTGDTAANAAGEYTVTSVAENGSSS